jgi:SAM-dependent methyltransferase
VSSITEGNARQYGDSRKLAARARLNSEYTIAETPWFPWVAQHLPLKAGDRVLDIGCGPGWFWASVADTLPEKLELTLADLSPGMVSEAMERCGRLRGWAVEGQQADAAQLPFADASFDGVVAMHMMYHLPDPAAALREMFRVLKPGGWLAVTTNGVGNMREIYALTTVFGSAPADPAGAAFGYEPAERLMRSRFGNATLSEHPARLHVTDREDVFLALTSYPPGDGASDTALSAFRAAIDGAFARGGGVLDVRKESALLLSRKALAAV